MSITLFTIGHSTHSAEEFVRCSSSMRLPCWRISAAFRVRGSFRSSIVKSWNGHYLRRESNIAGWKHSEAVAISAEVTVDNTGLRNASFKNYADYMQTPELRAAIEELLSLAATKRTATMCSESVFWRCHRRLVSDYLLAKGHSVQHIMPAGELRPHTLTAEPPRFQNERHISGERCETIPPGVRLAARSVVARRNQAYIEGGCPFDLLFSSNLVMPQAVVDPEELRQFAQSLKKFNSAFAGTGPRLSAANCQRWGPLGGTRSTRNSASSSKRT